MASKGQAFAAETRNFRGVLGNRGSRNVFGRWLRRTRGMVTGSLRSFVMLTTMIPAGMALAAAPSATPTMPAPAAMAPLSSAVPDIALYYGRDLPVDALQSFDWVVIDPTQTSAPDASLTPHTTWFARLDARDTVQTPEAFVDARVAPLWAKGYRNFLIDDGAPLVADADSDARIAARVKAVRARYADARLVLRNHLSLASSLAPALAGVLADGLLHRYDARAMIFVDTPADARQSALDQLKALREQSHLPTFAMDYCASADVACRRDTARTLNQTGVRAFVTDPDVETVGVGRIEVMPRKVLMVQAPGDGEPIDLTTGARDISMPLNYLGYDVQYVDVNKGPMPANVRTDRYAGIVVSIDRNVNNAGAWRRWLLARIHDGMRVAVIGQFGFPIDQQTAQVLGLERVAGTVPGSVVPSVVSKAPMMGFEIMPTPDVRDALGVRVGPTGQPLLRLQAGTYTYDMAGMLPWGGYTLNPYGVTSLAGIGQERWAIQPIDFLRQALALPQMPVPDVTTENGRRLMFVHVDGDGFASRAEFPGVDYGSMALYEQIYTKYPVPTTLSVIEGEVGAKGLYPKISPRLEEIARKMFALPNVEIGTHTFSHPFNLEQINQTTGERITGKANKEWGGDDAFSLDIPNYKFNLDREIQGSIDYINGRLAPPGKKVVVLQWPGDAQAPAIAIRKAWAAGVLSINGGDTIITKTNNSWTNIAPYGVEKGSLPTEFQVYAAVMDENVYTNDWLGPYYGYTRVLETFAMTDKPIRFKAVNLYYHMYSGTKVASLNALKEVYNAVLKQPVFPIFTTEYIRRVLDWRRVAVAREVAADGTTRWRVRSGADLREMRWPGAGVPVTGTSDDVAGYLPGPGGLYIHMGGDTAEFSIAPKGAERTPHIDEAAGFIRDFQRTGRNLSFRFGGYYKPFVSVANAAGCRISVDGVAKGRADGAGRLRAEVSGVAEKPVVMHTVGVDCD
ncbi:sugar ABC transporter [Pandoraea cepalis]|uniref:Sugar ABC transporter n=1 Tax=Pandoraea cepalis TaxID=2508294 RepID=A0A5E4XCZ9_9BURK|nr:sugar ABC transporter [Pandoraea cepalis]